MNIDSIQSIDILSNRYPAVYYVFDILYLDNDDLIRATIYRKKRDID